MFKQCVAIMMIVFLGQAAAQEQVVIDGITYRDPTQPAGVTRVEGEATVVRQGRSYDVSFIRTGGSNNMAVINGRMVTVGEMIDGARVVSIEKDAVTLDTGEERIEISTFRATFRSPAQQGKVE